MPMPDGPYKDHKMSAEVGCRGRGGVSCVYLVSLARHPRPLLQENYRKGLAVCGDPRQREGL